MTRTEKLRAMAEKYGANAPRIARLLGVKHQTARAWLSPKYPREIPEMKLQLLRYKLQKGKKS